MNLWDWFDRCRRRYLDERDADRSRLVDAYSRAYSCRETEPARAVAIFAEARDLAARLDEPWWRLVHEKFHLDALMHFQRDFRNVLEPARQLLLDVHVQSSADFPEPALFRDTLLTAYLGIDAEGYAEPIGRLLTELDQSLAEEPSAARYLLLARRRQFALEQERFEDAGEIVESELELASHDPDAERATHFSVFAHSGRCRIANHRGADDVLAAAAARAAELAQRCGLVCEQAEAQMWQAFAARRVCREDEAMLHHTQATATRQKLGMPPAPAYFAAAAAFHEQAGNLAAALTMRDEELAIVRGRNRSLHECRAHIERCRLLARLKQLLAEDLDRALAATAELRCPDRYVDQLETIQRRASSSG